MELMRKLPKRGEKSAMRQVVEAMLLSCQIGERVTYNHMAQAAGCTEDRVKTCTAAAIKHMEKAHRYAFKAIGNVGYERVIGTSAFDRSEAQRRGMLRKTDRALRLLQPAAEGAPDELKPLIVNRAMGLGVIRQFARQRKATRQRELPQKPDVTRFLESLKQKG